MSGPQRLSELLEAAIGAREPAPSQRGRGPTRSRTRKKQRPRKRASLRRYERMATGALPVVPQLTAAGFEGSLEVCEQLAELLAGGRPPRGASTEAWLDWSRIQVDAANQLVRTLRTLLWEIRRPHELMEAAPQKR